MKSFKPGDVANAVHTDGTEVKVRIESEESQGFYHVMFYTEDDQLSGQIQRVKTNELRRLKGPYFDIRGEVLTTAVSHLGEVAEIIGTGKGMRGNVFYKVQFNDGTTLWLNEHQVFIDDEVKRAHDEMIKDKNEFFN